LTFLRFWANGVDSAAMESITSLDRVFVFGDRVSFLIPHEWIEQTSENDHYLYQRPETDSGWLRVSLLTIKTVRETPSQCLQRMFANRDGVSVEEQTGNMVSASEKDSEEEGVKIHLYYWGVANIAPPDAVCEAVFSYTILLDRIKEAETVFTVKVIGQLASQAEFSTPV
jgi:hypothetical protein